MSKQKQLTILIPVYNGAKFLGGLLESFAAFLSDGTQSFVDECEIVVVNNRSEDATLEIARSFEKRIRNLRVITPETHVFSAEENVFRSFKLCRGEYTWVLGCDDIVRFEALPEVMQIARDGTYDIAIFNFMQSDKNGRIETLCNHFMSERIYDGDLVSFTQRMGFWWLIAGFSGQLVRTSRVVGFDHADLVSKTSPIYSHVTAYLECFAGCPAAIVNVQNVVYRLSDNDLQHWRRAAERYGVFDEYFWTLGYIRQIKHLESRGIVSRDYLVKMIENNRSDFFRPTVIIYDKLLAQLRQMNSVRHDPNQRNWMSPADFNELIEFFEQRDLLARPLLDSARRIYDALSLTRPSLDALFDESYGRLASYRSSFLLAANFIGVEGDYEIYRLSNTFYGVHRHFRGALVERIRYLDQADQAPIVFSGDTRADVITRILQNGVGLQWDSVPATLMRYCSEDIAHGTQSWSNVKPTQTPSTTSIGPPQEGLTLTSVQEQLRATYKSRKPVFTRLTAWLTVLGLKLSKRQIAIK
jgi:glycosyltransferase involved in cell wall biosynthesis